MAAAAAGWGLGAETAGYIAGLVVLAVVPQLLVALGLYLFIRWGLLAVKPPTGAVKYIHD